MKTGERLLCPGCGLQVIVLRPSAAVIELSCAGVELVGQADSGTSFGSHPADPQPALLGKRYTDPTGLEVLCTKAGSGALTVNGASMALKEAQQLPASD